jgi:hypothetical protein
MSVVGDLLRDAQALLQKGRSEKYEAIDGEDTPIDPIHEDAAKYSVWGALTRAAYDRRDSTGLDSAMVYLGVDNIQDPQLRGLNTLEDDKLNERFEQAIARADGGPVPGTSIDAERRMRDPKIDAEQAGRLSAEKSPDATRAIIADPGESK